MTPIDQLQTAFHNDDALELQRLLTLHPEFKAMVNAPIGPFDSPAIVNVKSRAMLDVLLEAGADINARSTWWAGGFGLLDSADPELSNYAIQRGATLTPHAAARLGMLEELKELVKANPEVVHERGGDGQMPLHFASTVEIAAFLLDHGADIDAKDVDHESTAAQWMLDNRQEVARYLISRGCKTDILMAPAVGDIDLVRKHLDADPDCIRMSVSDEYFPMIGSHCGGTIYQWTLNWYVRAHQVARKFGNDAVLQLLLDRSPDAVKLVDVCCTKDESAVRKLLNSNPNFADELILSDRRFLAHAARNNELEVVRLMLECGVPLDGTSQHKASALHWAAFHGNAEMTRLLLRQKPALETKDPDHQGTPLGWAIYGSENGWYCETGDYAGTVEALIEAGAAVSADAGGSHAVREVLLRNPTSR